MKRIWRAPSGVSRPVINTALALGAPEKGTLRKKARLISVSAGGRLPMAIFPLGSVHSEAAIGASARRITRPPVLCPITTT